MHNMCSCKICVNRQRQQVEIPTNDFQLLDITNDQNGYNNTNYATMPNADVKIETVEQQRYDHMRTFENISNKISSLAC